VPKGLLGPPPADAGDLVVDQHQGGNKPEHDGAHQRHAGAYGPVDAVADEGETDDGCNGSEWDADGFRPGLGASALVRSTASGAKAVSVSGRDAVGGARPQSEKDAIRPRMAGPVRGLSGRQQIEVDQLRNPARRGQALSSRGFDLAIRAHFFEQLGELGHEFGPREQGVGPELIGRHGYRQARSQAEQMHLLEEVNGPLAGDIFDPGIRPTRVVSSAAKVWKADQSAGACLDLEEVDPARLATQALCQLALRCMVSHRLRNLGAVSDVNYTHIRWTHSRQGENVGRSLRHEQSP
jgi:hypothetical protein